MRRALVPIAVLTLMTAACATTPAGDEPAATTAATTPVEVVETVARPESSFQLPDITSRLISRADLELMLPDGVSQSMPRTNEDLVTLAVLDRDDEASDIVRYGRLTGVGASYDDPAGAHVWIDVLSDPDAAHDYLVDAAGDIAKGIGGTHAPGVAARRTDEFAVDVGGESIGIVAEMADGTGSETLILTRAGRVVVFASHVHAPDEDARVRTQYLAEDALRGVVAVLTESSIDPTSTEIPPYRFQTTTTAVDEGGRTVITVTGIRHGDDRSCTVEIATEDEMSTFEYVEIAGSVWWRTGTGDFARVSPGNLDVAALRLACPAWPLPAGAAGVGNIVEAATDPARHHVNGVDAAGYRSDADGLAVLLGRPALTSEVDGFSFWVADEAPWLVELAISMTGPAEERRLLTGPFADPDGSGTVTVRHRVFEIGEIEESIVPPS